MNKVRCNNEYAAEKAKLKDVRNKCYQSPPPPSPPPPSPPPPSPPPPSPPPPGKFMFIDKGDMQFTPVLDNVSVMMRDLEAQQAFSTRELAIEYLKTIEVYDDNIGDEKDYIIRSKDVMIKGNPKKIFQIVKRITNGGKKSKKRKIPKKKIKKHKKSRKRKSRKASSRR